jgi:hypothetical protein
MTSHLTKPMQAIHFLILAFLMTFGGVANSGLISKRATAHISCYASLHVVVEGKEESFPELNKKRLAHEQKYISTGLSDLQGRQDSFVRNGALYRLGKYAEYRERVQRQKIYCDNPNVYDHCESIVWSTIEEVNRLALKFYRMENCELLLK